MNISELETFPAKWSREDYERWLKDGTLCEKALPDDKSVPNQSTSRKVAQADRRYLPTADADLCAGKHGDDFASVLAHDRAKAGKSRMYAILREVLEAHGPLTTHEIACILGEENRNKFAPRLTEMRAFGWIERTGTMRGGCHVLRLSPNEG
ncbi:MAG: hypothetical protein WA639_12825 [Candidatus Acidiferrum sp.]